MAPKPTPPPLHAKATAAGDTLGSPLVTSTLQCGAAAEALAARYLQARGLVIIARNLRCKAGELDLVCVDGEVLVIVEVRQRGRADFGGALASVTWRKQRKLVRATQFFWQRQIEWQRRLLRFDVVALQGQPTARPVVTWIKDAFRAI
jgi:putative endonuclease